MTPNFGKRGGGEMPGMGRPRGLEEPPEVAQPEPEPDGDESSTGVTPEMLSYHAGSDNCGACVHFTAPETCDRFPDPVEETGWCRGFEAGDAGAAEQGAEQVEEPLPQEGV
jgi:hypothetical protein